MYPQCGYSFYITMIGIEINNVEPTFSMRKRYCFYLLLKNMITIASNNMLKYKTATDNHDNNQIFCSLCQMIIDYTFPTRDAAENLAEHA
jgi:hypothetical protein